MGEDALRRGPAGSARTHRAKGIYSVTYPGIILTDRYCLSVRRVHGPSPFSLHTERERKNECKVMCVMRRAKESHFPISSSFFLLVSDLTRSDTEPKNYPQCYTLPTSLLPPRILPRSDLSAPPNLIAGGNIPSNPDSIPGTRPTKWKEGGAGPRGSRRKGIRNRIDEPRYLNL